MGEKSDQIEQQINRTRNDLSENFSELKHRVRTTLDWRAQFEERPMTMMAVAFGGGLLLSAILPSRRAKLRHSAVGNACAEPDQPAQTVSLKQPTATDDKTNENIHQPSDTLEALKLALVGVAASKIGGVAGDLLAAFKEELKKAARPTGAQPSRASDEQTTRQSTAGAGI
jgi:hypothetical protein